MDRRLHEGFLWLACRDLGNGLRDVLLLEGAGTRLSFFWGRKGGGGAHSFFFGGGRNHFLFVCCFFFGGRGFP